MEERQHAVRIAENHLSGEGHNAEKRFRGALILKPHPPSSFFNFDYSNVLSRSSALCAAVVLGN
jgi:hypothetical protein